MSLRHIVAGIVSVATVAVVVLVAPLTSASAATTCAAAWNSTAVYTGGMTASLNGHNYLAKWWTQNESPATHSGQWDVWTNNGAC